MARITYNDISISWGGGLGMYGWCCSCMVDGYRVHRMYMEYTKREALKLFHAYVNKKGC